MVRKAVREKGARAPRGSLTEKRIVAAALAVLARDGLEGVTMRGVAQEIGTAPMSLYRHLRGRDALIELLRRHVMAPAAAAAVRPATGTWRRRLRTLLHEARAHLRRHRGAVALFDSENFRQPAASAAVEHALECLTVAGLDATRAARTSAALWMYTVGAVLAEQSAAAAWPGEDVARARRARWVTATQATLRRDAPRVAAMVPRWSALSHDRVFAEGLELLLAGVEASVR
jgi:AcrR family transcriptional regulator